MNEFERQFEELKSFLEFSDYTILTKRIIDLVLDTQDISYYKLGTDFLEWLDLHEHQTEAKKAAYADMLAQLHQALHAKPVVSDELLLTATGLSKACDHGFSLGPVDFELKRGEILGLVGENGNGKTTLLRLLCGELFATAGSLQYNFSNSDSYDLRSQLVYIPQRTDTWYGSMFENLQFTAASYGYLPEENELVVELIIARLGLRKYRKHSWKNLSSGYKMRFELARMLLRKPKILLIDEPLANLDILAQQTILEDFRAIAKSPFRPIGIVLSSQQLYEVEKTSDQVIFLKNGKQRNLHQNVATEENIRDENQLVIEFESSWAQAQLGELFSQHSLVSLQFNGGTYIATFAENVTVHDFMKIAIASQLPILYFRNISNSTRRFFVS